MAKAKQAMQKHLAQNAADTAETVSMDDRVIVQDEKGKAQDVTRLYQKDVEEMVSKDTKAVIKAQTFRSQADSMFKTAFIETGKKLARKGFALFTTEEKDQILGGHGVHVFYLKRLKQRLMEERKEEKPSAYTRRVTSDVGALLTCIQVGVSMGPQKFWRVPTGVDEKGNPTGERWSVEKPSRLFGDLTWSKIKEAGYGETQRDVTDYMEKYSGNARDLIKDARIIKAHAGFKSKKARKRKTKAEEPMTTTEIRDAVHDMNKRLNKDTFPVLLAGVLSLGRQSVPAANHTYYDTQCEGFLIIVNKALNEAIGVDAKRSGAGSLNDERIPVGKRGQLREEQDGALTAQEKAVALARTKPQTDAHLAVEARLAQLAKAGAKQARQRGKKAA